MIESELSLLVDPSGSRNGHAGPSKPVTLLAEVTDFAAGLLDRLAGQAFSPVRLCLRNGPVRFRLLIDCPDAGPIVRPVDSGSLNECEQGIVEVLGTHGKLAGPRISELVGYPYDTHLKTCLSNLRKRGIIGNMAPGYILVKNTEDRIVHSSQSFVPTDFQSDILNALDGRAFRADALAGELGVDRRRLYQKPGGIGELIDHGLVKRHSRAGYYRPDALPEELK